MLKPLVALIAGLLFGLGLIVSGMVYPAKVLAFLDVASPRWDPSLVLVLLAAVSVASLGFALARGRGRPLLDASFSAPTRHRLDASLVVGSVVFGIGWGLVGYCPGPALAAVALGAPRAAEFVAAMLVGMVGYAGLDRLLAKARRAA